MSAQSLKILLVDDARDQYTFVRDLIVGLGEPNFSLDWSSNYAAGLEQIERREHDVCLVDYRLGQRDGLELIKEARAKGCQTPLILLTGDGNRELSLVPIPSSSISLWT